MRTNRTQHRETIAKELQGTEHWRAFDHLIEGCQIIGNDWTYRYLNKTALAHARQPLEKLLGRTMMECYPGIETTGMFAVLRKCMEERTVDTLENEFTYPDGARGWFELRIEPIEEGILILSYDISQRKRTDLRIQHLARLYATLSQVNQTIVRVKERDKLFNSICNVAVEFGKFELAWVGLVDHATGKVTPTAVYGKAQDNIPFQNINYKQMPFKKALIGKAVTTGSVVYSRDIQKDPTMVHWHTMAKQFNFHSCAVIPFLLNNEVVGFAKLYSSDIDFFDSEEQHNLLKEMSLDVSFALSTMEESQRRKEAEEKQRQSQELFLKAFHSNTAGIAISKLNDGTFIDVNEEACAIYGYPREAIIGRTSVELGLLSADARKKLRDALESQGRLKSTEVTLNSGTGKQRDVLFSWEPIEINGEQCVLASLIDLTERNRAVERALEFAQRNEALVQALGQIVYEWFPNTNKLIWSGDFTRVLGYLPLDIGETTESWISRIHPDDFGRAQKEYENAVRKKKNFDLEYRFRHKDGSYLWMHDRGILYFNENGELDRIIGVLTDISERKKIEEALQKSEAFLYLQLERMPMACIVWDAEFRVVQWNPAAEHIFGYSKAETLGKHPYDLIVPAEAKNAVEFVWRKLLEGDDSAHSVNENITKEGKTIICDWTNTPLKENDTIIGVLSMVQDITERKQAEKDRLELLNLLQNITANMPGVIFQLNINPEGPSQFRYISEGCETIFGIPKSLLQTNASAALSYIHKEDLETVRTSFMDALTSHTHWSSSFRIAHPNGKTLWAEAYATTLQEQNGEKVTYGCIIDITGRKKLEEQYLRSQRMESVGTLAGGIAHDLNNILAPIMLSLQFLKKRSTEPADEKMLDMLETQTKRGADLVKQVLAFARGAELQRTTIQIRYLIDELVKFARNTLPANISIETFISKDLWTILGDPTQIHQVLLNLCVNARDAMPNGGTLTIIAENTLLDEQYARMNPSAKAGPYVVVKVKDNGVGMPPEIQQKIFEPFFTTKEIGKGTGLGLSTVYSLVKEHGGFVSVYSEVGRGTEFRIYLPATESAETKQAEETATQLPQGNGEYILFVDDEAAVLEIAKISLELNGYKVIVAHDGTEAIGLFAQHKQDINLVITDMNMPFMDGPSLIRALRKMDPQLRVIGSSGLADKAKLAEAQSLGTNDFISKPFTTDNLLHTIMKVLNEKPV